MARPTPKVLLQTQVRPTTRRQLDALARVRGCSRSAYLGRLVEMHVRAVTPQILRALDQSSPRVIAPKVRDPRSIS